MGFFKKKNKTIEPPKKRPSSILKGIEENKINMKMMSASIREIQAPVADLIGLQSVIADIPAESSIYHYAKSMNACGVLLASMIENMKFYYLLCSGLYEVEIFPFVLRAEIMTTWNKIIGETNMYSNFNEDIVNNTGTVTCSIDIKENVPTGLVNTDNFALMKIFQCVLSNAIKFTLEGEVKAEIYISGDEDTILNIVVSDTGIGIPEDVQDKIFNPLTKAHSESIQGGVGMGLPVSKEMAKVLDGKLVLVESIENKGSVFHITIPINFSKVNHEINRSFHSDTVLDLRASDKKGSSVILDIESDEEGPTEMPMVLLAEDIKLNRIIVTKMLGDVNVIIKTAENGIDAVEECKRHKFDIILMDIIMPQMGGLEATLEIRKNCPLNLTTPIIALTGILAGRIKTECLRNGMVDCIQKPVIRKHLIETVAMYTEPIHRRWILDNSHMD